MQRLCAALGVSWSRLQSTLDPEDGRAWQRAIDALPVDSPLREQARALKLDRRRLRRHFAYSVPSPEAIAVIQALGVPWLELGAGKGYWAALLRAHGVSVVANDHTPAEANRWLDGDPAFITDLVTTSAVGELVRDHPTHGLMLQWVPPDTGATFAVEALAALAGDIVAVVGEDRPGVCGSPALDQALHDFGPATARLALPRFPGLVDTLTCYQRRPRTGVRESGDEPAP